MIPSLDAQIDEVVALLRGRTIEDVHAGLDADGAVWIDEIVLAPRTPGRGRRLALAVEGEDIRVYPAGDGAAPCETAASLLQEASA